MLITPLSLFVLTYLPHSISEPVPPRQAQSNTGVELHKIVFTEDRLPELDRVRRSGTVTREFDYGGFTLVLARDPILGLLPSDATPGVSVRDDWNLIRFNGLTLNGAHPDSLLSQLSALETISGSSRDSLPVEAGLFVL